MSEVDYSWKQGPSCGKGNSPCGAGRDLGPGGRGPDFILKNQQGLPMT